MTGDGGTGPRTDGEANRCVQRKSDTCRQVQVARVQAEGHLVDAHAVPATTSASSFPCIQCCAHVQVIGGELGVPVSRGVDEADSCEPARWDLHGILKVILETENTTHTLPVAPYVKLAAATRSTSKAISIPIDKRRPNRNFQDSSTSSQYNRGANR